MRTIRPIWLRVGLCRSPSSSLPSRSGSRCPCKHQTALNLTCTWVLDVNVQVFFQRLSNNHKTTAHEPIWMFGFQPSGSLASVDFDGSLLSQRCPLYQFGFFNHLLRDRFISNCWDFLRRLLLHVCGDQDLNVLGLVPNLQQLLAILNGQNLGSCLN